MVYPKRRTGRKSVAYEEAVRQALCYGWIDSIIKRLDDERYMRKFTPRTVASKWSRSNVKRAMELIEAGLMTEAGYAVLPARKIASLRKIAFQEKPVYSAVPGFIAERLSKEAKAGEFFRSLPPSHRRNYVAWIMDAKREKTRLRRLDKAVGFLSRRESPLL
jgi:uncharacterized protein YdeI (YjbR/CyaY-like superfamily)